MNKENLKRISQSAMFLAIGMILPFFTSQVKELGDKLLPMHIPVLFCGLICGPKYGLMVGFILPFLRSLLFSMPRLYPNAVTMAFELATYGFVIGLMYYRCANRKIGYLYLCLVSSMISGRVVWGIAKLILFGLEGNSFTFGAFIAGGVVNAIPGIIIQLILIPAVMKALIRAGVIKE